MDSLWEWTKLFQDLSTLHIDKLDTIRQHKTRKSDQIGRCELVKHTLARRNRVYFTF